jgi:hypothetical protein
MPIDISREALLTPTEAARKTRRHIASVYRSFFKPKEGFLCEHIKIGGRTFTSLEALQRYAERVTAARLARRAGATPSTAGTASSVGRTVADRRKAAERAARALDDAGIR